MFCWYLQNYIEGDLQCKIIFLGIKGVKEKHHTVRGHQPPFTQNQLTTQQLRLQEFLYKSLKYKKSTQYQIEMLEMQLLQVRINHLGVG